MWEATPIVAGQWCTGQFVQCEAEAMFSPRVTCTKASTVGVEYIDRFQPRGAPDHSGHLCDEHALLYLMEANA